MIQMTQITLSSIKVNGPSPENFYSIGIILTYIKNPID